MGQSLRRTCRVSRTPTRRAARSRIVSLHRGVSTPVVNGLMGYGSVHFFSDNIDSANLSVSSDADCGGSALGSCRGDTLVPAGYGIWQKLGFIQDGQPVGRF